MIYIVDADGGVEVEIELELDVRRKVKPRTNRSLRKASPEKFSTFTISLTIRLQNSQWRKRERRPLLERPEMMLQTTRTSAPRCA